MKRLTMTTVQVNKKGWNLNDLIKYRSAEGTVMFLLAQGDGTRNDMLGDTWQVHQLLVLSDDPILEGDRAKSSYLDNVTEMTGVEWTDYLTVQADVRQTFKRVIASYPQLPGTLPISKETVQAWIDAGRPDEGLPTWTVGGLCLLGHHEITKGEGFKRVQVTDEAGCIELNFTRPWTSIRPTNLGGRSPQAVLSPSSGVEPAYEPHFKRAEPEQAKFTVQQMLEAIRYGFEYSRDSQHDGVDVPEGNKLQWILGKYVDPLHHEKFINEFKEIRDGI